MSVRKWVVNWVWVITYVNSSKLTHYASFIFGPFVDFNLHLSIFLLEILNIASHLSCEAVLKISSKNIEKCRRKDQDRFGNINISMLVLLTVLHACSLIAVIVDKMVDTGYDER